MIRFWGVRVCVCGGGGAAKVWPNDKIGDFFSCLEIIHVIYGGSTLPSDLTLNYTERLHTVCVVGDLYASKRMCGLAGLSALRAVFLF